MEQAFMWEVKMNRISRCILALLCSIAMLLPTVHGGVLAITEAVPTNNGYYVYADPSGVTFVPSGYTYIDELENGEVFAQTNYGDDTWVYRQELSPEIAAQLDDATTGDAGEYITLDDGSVIRTTTITSDDRNSESYDTLRKLLFGDSDSGSDNAPITFMREAYQQDDMVKVMILTEEESVVELCGLKLGDDLDVEKKQLINDLKDKQLSLLRSIEAELGYDLEVTGQFTMFINALAVNIRYSDISKLNKLNGVRKAFITPRFTVPDEEVSEAEYPEKMEYASSAMNVEGAWSLGYKGEGMLISIVDTGLGYGSPVFEECPADSSLNALNTEEVAELIESGLLHATQANTESTVESYYYNDKIPFGYNYGQDQPDYGNDYMFGHGTHVAGIAAGKVPSDGSLEDKYGLTKLGVAPEAQLLIMRIADDNGYMYFDSVNAAIEDSILLGADCINLSFGSDCGPVYYEGVTEFYANAAAAGVSMIASAGNCAFSGYNSNWGDNAVNAEHPSTGTIGMPGTFDSVLTAGSADNTAQYSAECYIKWNMDTPLGSYMEKVLKIFELDGVPYEEQFAVRLGGQYYGWVNNDFENAEGKLLFIPAEEMMFNADEDMQAAYEAGALGICYYGVNDVNYVLPEYSELLLPTVWIPAVFLEVFNLFDGSMDGKEVYVQRLWENNTETAGEMSFFSSYGPTEGLTIKPEIVGIGGNVFSTYLDGRYAVMSGTSMSAPAITGCTALVKQYLRANGFADADPVLVERIAYCLLMSTASPIIDSEHDVLYSVRRQGAGLVNVAAALSAESYISVDGTDKAKIELFDDPDRTGEYVLNFSVNNISDHEVTYSIDTTALGQVAYGGITYHYSGQLYLTYDYMQEIDCSVDGPTGITVAPGETVDVTLTLRISDQARSYIEERFKYGSYIEGYVTLTPDTGVSLSVPFLGFYGNWNEAPMFESGGYDTLLCGERSYVTADQFHNSMWGSINDSYGPFCTEECPLAENIYLGDTTDCFDTLDTPYHENWNPYTDGRMFWQDRAGISPNGDNQLDSFSMGFGLLRNADSIIYRVTDAETGEVYWDETMDFASRTYCSTSNYSVLYLGCYGQFVLDWLFPRDEQGNYIITEPLLPENTQVIIHVEAIMEGLSDNSENANSYVEFPLYIDMTTPDSNFDIGYVEDWFWVDLGFSDSPLPSYTFTTDYDEEWYLDWEGIILYHDGGTVGYFTSPNSFAPGYTAHRGYRISNSYNKAIHIAADYAGNYTTHVVDRCNVAEMVEFPSELTVTEGDIFTVENVSEAQLYDISFMWYSDNENLTVLTGSDSQSEYGEFLAAAPGEATITVTYGQGIEWNILVHILPQLSAGDMDMDGQITSIDALIVLRYCHGLIQLTPEQLELADMNGDGAINTVDALIILRMAVLPE